MKANQQVDAKQVYEYIGLLVGGLRLRESVSSTADKQAVKSVFARIGTFEDGGDFHRTGHLGRRGY